jgi:hypothetical protein
MIINSKNLHLPPYVSTSWDQVASLHMQEQILNVTLNNGRVIVLPYLSKEITEAIFKAHADHLEQEITEKKQPTSINPLVLEQTMSPFAQSLANMEQNSDSPFRFGFSTLDGIGSSLQHDSRQSDAPDLPPEILEKISAISKIIAPVEVIPLPKAEANCNCIHCQIARAIRLGVQGEVKESVHEEPPISEEDLHFQQWDVQHVGDKVYTVTNKLDLAEKYNVYLGEPLGCTCGNSGCEHILAVLKS